jgi:hypothetical protein
MTGSFLRDPPVSPRHRGGILNGSDAGLIDQEKAMAAWARKAVTYGRPVAT